MSEQEAGSWCWYSSDVPSVLSSWTGKLCPVSLLPGDAPSFLLLVSPPLWGCTFAVIRADAAGIQNLLIPHVRTAAYKDVMLPLFSCSDIEFVPGLGPGIRQGLLELASIPFGL